MMATTNPSPSSNLWRIRQREATAGLLPQAGTPGFGGVSPPTHSSTGPPPERRPAGNLPEVPARGESKFLAGPRRYRRAAHRAARLSTSRASAAS